MDDRMRVHWLQHAEHEGLGCIGPWLASRSARVRHTPLHRGELPPAIDEFDWLIVMGGPMNIYEHQAHPWLIAEKKLIRDACVKNKKVLGICLGAQLLADVLGAKVTTNREQEIGWFDVTLTEEGHKSPLLSGSPATFPAFHWHGDTFSMPKGHASLIKSDACVNQAFALDTRLVGFQFHLEVREVDVRDWLVTDAPTPARYVQTAAEMLRDPGRFAEQNKLMAQVLERMADA
jgi:GMP synthase-like glutamine amidotransferase